LVREALGFPDRAGGAEANGFSEAKLATQHGATLEGGAAGILPTAEGRAAFQRLDAVGLALGLRSALGVVSARSSGGQAEQSSEKAQQGASDERCPRKPIQPPSADTAADGTRDRPCERRFLPRAGPMHLVVQSAR